MLRRHRRLLDHVRGLEVELSSQLVVRERARRRDVERGPLASVGQHVSQPPRRAVAGDPSLPLLRALGEIAAEAGEPDLPVRRCQVLADQRAVGRVPQRPPCERALHVVGVGRDQVFPARVGLVAAGGERVQADAHRRVARPLDGRRIERPLSQRRPCHEAGGAERDHEPRAPGRPRGHGQHLGRANLGLGFRVRRVPCGVAERCRQFGQAALAQQPPRDDGERERAAHDHGRLIDAAARRGRCEQRQREQRQIEEIVRDDGGQQAETQVDEAPDQRRHEQLDRPRVGRPRGVVRVRAAEDDRLRDEADGDPQLAIAEPVADQGRPRKRDGAEQRLLPESGVQRRRHRRQPRQVSGEHVRVDQRFGRRPPLPQPRRDQVERDDVAELDAGEQRAPQRAAHHRAARRPLA